MADRPIEAAGGVVWRPAVGGGGIEVGLVHRPKYDDWSLPKGKLTVGEHVIVGAQREVWEETGFDTIAGRPLGEIRYLKDGAPKRVRYWALRIRGGGFAPNSEVDQMMWLPPREAQLHLLPDRDRGVVAGFARETADTWACVLVRHASAGERSAWRSADRDRPLDDTGVDQADALVPVLGAWAPRRVLSADVLRCLETVGPFAEQHRLTVESEPLVSETGFGSSPHAAIERMIAVVSGGEPSVVCSQGRALPALIIGICRHFGVPVPAETAVRKGGMVVVHASRDPLGAVRVVAVERLNPPAV